MTDKSKLIAIRCPYSRTAKKNGHVFPCDRLLIRVTPGSSGEAWCWSCRKRIDFEISKTDVAMDTSNADVWATA